MQKSSNKNIKSLTKDGENVGKINVLPKNIAELIAAGEVVERPASVVKELCENSIDAGATAVTVEVRNGGITYIRITDNGSGIFRDDVQKAFLSHATSKLKTAADLDSIFTLGFRGEALASIAAVSRIELFTKTVNEENGTFYSIEGGTETKNETAGCPDGTTIVVRDLFYNTPARMKFLKKDVSEANAVADVVDKLALSHPEISFRFIRDGKQTLITPGDGKLLSVIYSIFGRVFAEGMIETNYELEKIGVSGFVCKPTSARPSRAMQYFFLNGRFIKSRGCAASMENAYKNSIMVGKFPSCVLNITVPPHTVDVNVHPAKTEVRFSDERRVSSAIYYAVKNALSEYDTRLQIDLAKVAQKTKPENAQFYMVEDEPPKAKAPEEKKVSVSPAASRPLPKRDFWQSMPSEQFKTGNTLSSVKNDKLSHRDDENEPDLVSAFKTKRANERTLSQNEQKIPTEPKNECSVLPSGSQFEKTSVAQTENAKPEILKKSEPEKSRSFVAVTDKQPPKPLRLLGEAFKTYIICEYDGKVCIIDKHAAHERVIFNRMKKEREEKETSSQVLLSPVTVTLSKNEYGVILENLDVFSKCGFLVEDFGNGAVIVRECPMLLEEDDVQDVILEIANNLMLNKTDVQAEKIDRIYHTAACKAAIKAGFKNSTAELKALAERVLYNDDVRYCPHGRPVLIEMSRYDLEKQFGRIQ